MTDFVEDKDEKIFRLEKELQDIYKINTTFKLNRKIHYLRETAKIYRLMWEECEERLEELKKGVRNFIEEENKDVSIYTSNFMKLLYKESFEEEETDDYSN